MAIWTHLERSWSHFGGLREVLGRSWAHLEWNLAHLGDVLGPSWPVLGGSWGFLERSWRLPGTIQEQFIEDFLAS